MQNYIAQIGEFDDGGFKQRSRRVSLRSIEGSIGISHLHVAIIFHRPKKMGNLRSLSPRRAESGTTIASLHIDAVLINGEEYH